jgi:4-hydroxy-3-polyprenylbenzoate decarboxylase
LDYRPEKDYSRKGAKDAKFGENRNFHMTDLGAILDAQRLGLTLGYSDIRTDQELVSRLEGKVIEWERRSSEFPAKEVSEGPLLENRAYGSDVNLFKFPIPKWHEHDGGRYLGTGCIVITQDPDTGVVNLGTYRLMVHDEKTLALHI